MSQISIKSKNKHEPSNIKNKHEPILPLQTNIQLYKLPGNIKNKIGPILPQIVLLELRADNVLEIN
jgi:hypothetical protein